MAKKTYSPVELKEIANRLKAIWVKQRDTSIKYRQPKLEKIMKGEELYFNIVARTLKGRFNIPLPIVSGFVEALLAKIDDEIEINFDSTHDSDKIRSRKMSAAIKWDAAPNRGDWRIKDLLTKKLAIFSGVGINKIYSESDPTYKNCLFVVDSFDFHCEATGGNNLNNHLFRGVDNVYRSKKQLQTNSKSGLYDTVQVEKLLTWTPAADSKKEADQLYRNRQNRHKSLALDVDSNDFTGVDSYNMAEWEMYDNETGEWFYVFWHINSGEWIRIAPLAEITGEADEYEQPKSMFKAWHTHPDHWNFWSKAPIDDIIPIAVALKALTNFMFDEVQKRLWGQRLFDPEIISDPAMLEWDRPDKLIMATVPNGKRLSDGVWEFPTSDKSTVTINMLDYFRNFAAVESGVTPGAKGESDEKLLGIAKINLGEAADRFGLLNVFYTNFYTELADAWLRGAKMCLTEKRLIQMIGEDGAESVELTKEDTIFTNMPAIRIVGGKSEARKNEELRSSKSAALTEALTLFPNQINSKIAISHLLTNAHWKIDEITPLLDVSTDGDEDESSYASQAIEDILANKKPELYQGATTRFVQKIIDFAKKRQTNPTITTKLMKYAMAHMQGRPGQNGQNRPSIVVDNMAREAMMRNLNPGTGNPASPTKPVAPNSVAANQPTPAALPNPGAPQ